MSYFHNTIYPCNKHYLPYLPLPSMPCLHLCLPTYHPTYHFKSHLPTFTLIPLRCSPLTPPSDQDYNSELPKPSPSQQTVSSTPPPPSPAHDPVSTTPSSVSFLPLQPQSPPPLRPASSSYSHCSPGGRGVSGRGRELRRWRDRM